MTLRWTELCEGNEVNNFSFIYFVIRLINITIKYIIIKYI